MSNPHLTGTLYGWYWATAYGDLTNDQRLHNAQQAVNILCRNNFTHAAAAGIVGNMWAESTMSPGCWEEWTDEPNMTRGYGLVQWTGNVDHSGMNPYIYWADQNGWDWENNGPLEMNRILYERDNNIEFVGSAQYPGGWLTFQNIGLVEDPQTIQDDVEYAAGMFLYDYLRPTPEEAAATVGNRKTLAWMVYQNTKKPVPAWLLFKMSQLNRKKYRGG